MSTQQRQREEAAADGVRDAFFEHLVETLIARGHHPVNLPKAQYLGGFNCGDPANTRAQVDDLSFSFRCVRVGGGRYPYAVLATWERGVEGRFTWEIPLSALTGSPHAIAELVTTSALNQLMREQIEVLAASMERWICNERVHQAAAWARKAEEQRTNETAREINERVKVSDHSVCHVTADEDDVGGYVICFSRSLTATEAEAILTAAKRLGLT